MLKIKLNVDSLHWVQWKYRDACSIDLQVTPVIQHTIAGYLFVIHTPKEWPERNRLLYMYIPRQTSNIRRTSVRNKIVDHSHVIACRRCSNYIFILHLVPGFNGLGRNNCKTTRELFKFLGFGAPYIRNFTVYLDCLWLDVKHQIMTFLEGDSHNSLFYSSKWYIDGRFVEIECMYTDLF